MKIALIAAMDDERAIGKNGTLPWYLPEDLNNFKTLTSWHTIVMGRATYESIGRPLPNRRNIVLTSHNIPDVETYSSLSDCLTILEKTHQSYENIFVIWWAQVYQSFLALNTVDEIWLSRVCWVFGGDTFFPRFEEKFSLVSRQDFETFSLERYQKMN